MSLVKKPTGLKKPVVKKPAVKSATPIKPKEENVSENKPEPQEVSVEEVVKEEPETVIEIPVVTEEVEEVAPELFEENDKFDEKIEEEMIEEVNAEDIKTPPEIVESEKEPEPIVIEEPKSKKKSTKKSKKKEEPKQVESVKEANTEDVTEQLPQMSLEKTIETMSPEINIVSQEWEEAKQEIQDKLKALTIDPDANPTIMKNLIGELDELLTDLRFLFSEVEDQVEALNSQIEYIRVTNSKGNNAEERKAAGYLALVHYKKNPDDVETINLIQYQNFMNGKLRFLNNAVKTVEGRQKLLITFSGILKIENSL